MDRETKIDFINKCLKTKKGTKITKKYLRNCSDEYIDSICERFNDTFNNYLANPPKKLTKFYADAVNPEGKVVTFEGKFESDNAFKDDLLKDGYKVKRIVLARGRHICQYCGTITNGTQKDILCNDCQMTFGHYSYNEL